jgi:hypothetical protein
MLNFIKAFFRHNLGANIDSRSKEKKEKDYSYEEVYSAFGVIYKTREKGEVVMEYPRKSQNLTSSCVAHATVLSYAIERKQETGEWFDGSEAFIYKLRSNYPEEGMIGDNASDILVNVGLTEYKVLPTPFTEKEINALTITPKMIADAGKNKAKSYVSAYKVSWSQIAPVVSPNEGKGKPVTIFIYASKREWSREYPTLEDKPKLGSAEVQHAVTILPDSVFNEGGVNYVVVQDSAWFGGKQIRYVSEEFINTRAYYMRFFTELKYELKPEKPQYVFTKELKVGERSDEVMKLQEALQYLGYFPSKVNGAELKPTGFYGGITRQAVKDFQEAYKKDVLYPIGLSKGTGYFGKMSLKKLNEILNG